MTSENIICPVCESGSLVEKVASEKFTYKEVDFEISEFKYSACTECGAEIVTPQQRRINDQKVRDNQRIIDGFLSGSEIRKIRKKFGLTQADAALIFGGGANAFSKYEKGEVVQSTAMDRLIRVTDMIPGVFESLITIAMKQSSVVTKSKRLSNPSHCDYGKCKISDSEFLPANVVSLKDIRETRKKSYGLAHGRHIDKVYC